ncbi:MAG: anti-sigma factor [Aquihabitans sp.]
MNNDLHALVGPYLVDALDDEEHEEFEAHLEDCDQCRQEVGDLIEVPALLASSESAPVSAELRAAVLDEVARTPQEQPARLLQPAAPARRVVSAGPRHRLNQGLLAAAAAIVVIVGALGVMSVRSSDQRAQKAESALSVFQAPDRSTATFEGELGSIEVVTSAQVGATVITGSDVPALAAGRTYELWFVDEDGASPAGTFTADGGNVVHRVDGVAPGTVAITEEPIGGSPQPTGPILATATIGA